VFLVVFKQPGANVIETVNRIKAQLPRLIAAIPPAIKIKIISDQTLTIRAAVEHVQITLFITIVLVIMVIFVFLRSFWATVIPAVTVPLALLGACALMWAVGSFSSPRISLPRDPFVSTAWQSLIGGLVIFSAGMIGGELGDVHPAEWSARSVGGLLYLITFGSLLAFTCYAWLLQNAPISKVSTYAYVNPVVAIALGALVLDEQITLAIAAGAALIVGSVFVAVRSENAAAAAATRRSPGTADVRGTPADRTA